MSLAKIEARLQETARFSDPSLPGQLKFVTEMFSDLVMDMNNAKAEGYSGLVQKYKQALDLTGPLLVKLKEIEKMVASS